MKKRYNYLQDGKAVEEILKHKWIESEKLGRDIGFATAAWDWINKYGQEWKQHHQQKFEQHIQNLEDLIERRRYRRFKSELSAKVIRDTKEDSIMIKDINCVDICFLSKTELSEQPTLTLKVYSDKSSNPSIFNISLKLTKSVLLENQRTSRLPYLNIARFEEPSQKEIIKNKKIFFN